MFFICSICSTVPRTNNLESGISLVSGEGLMITSPDTVLKTIILAPDFFLFQFL